MPAMPPPNQETKYNEQIERLIVALRAAGIAGHDFLGPVVARLHPRLVKGLRAEGLDGGNWRSRFLHHGDAEKTVKWILEPGRAAVADLYNFSVNCTTLLKRFKIGYVDAIKDARNSKTDDDVVIVR
jgi:hypothetical protein